jgi:hypothetical protein
MTSLAFPAGLYGTHSEATKWSRAFARGLRGGGTVTELSGPTTDAAEPPEEILLHPCRGMASQKRFRPYALSDFIVDVSIPREVARAGVIQIVEVAWAFLATLGVGNAAPLAVLGWQAYLEAAQRHICALGSLGKRYRISEALGLEHIDGRHVGLNIRIALMRAGLPRERVENESLEALIDEALKTSRPLQ